MENPYEIIDVVLSEASRLQKTISRKDSTQVRSLDEKGIIKAFAYSWIKTHRPQLEKFFNSDSFSEVNDTCTELLESSEKATARTKYKSLIKSLKKDLITLRSEIINKPPQEEANHDDFPPDFSELIHDKRMQTILIRRWEETLSCLSVKADLAATIMMGGLLEALFLARVNLLDGKKKDQLFKCQSAPNEPSTGKKAPLQKWTLKDYVDVSHEMGWIRETGRDVGRILRDYRNFVHPAKELSHSIEIKTEDAQLFWVVFKSLANQILKSI